MQKPSIKDALKYLEQFEDGSIDFEELMTLLGVDRQSNVLIKHYDAIHSVESSTIDVIMDTFK